MTDLFLSYSSKSWELALRLRRDLTRAGVQVWTYQSSGKAGVNFREEYRQVIEKAKHFCVIDSPESRLSTHVKKECQIARECKKPIYVCHVAPRDGSAHEDWWSTNLPFDDFNEIRVILLSDGNYFDGVKELCFALKIHFLPDDLTFPRKDEFWEELAAAQVPFKERDKLLEAWWTFVTLYVEDIRIGEAQLRVLLTLVRQCIGKETVSLLISHGLVLSEMECYDEALCQFRIAISLNPFDPRAWAAAAGAEYRLGNYSAALTSYRRADQILTRQDIPQSDINLPALVHNVSRTLEALGHYREAKKELERLNGDDSCDPHVLALLGRLEKKTNPRLAVRLLETAMEKCCISKNDFKLPLITDLLWCYRELNDRDKEGQLIFQAISTFGDAAHIWKEAANFFLDRKDLKGVIHCLEKAVSLAPESIEFHAELSRIYSQAGDVQRANVIVLDYLSSRLSKPSEIYFLGLALYKSGARELAELAYDRVRDDPLVSYWGSYDSLL